MTGPRNARFLSLTALAVAAILCSAWLALRAVGSARMAAEERPSPRSAIRLGILGDSDSHSYQDRVSFPPGTRFGAYRAVTLQWPEVLARLRPGQIDPGPWGVRGTRRSVAELMDRVGLGGRFPRKEDYLYNFAFSGARCDSLLGYQGRQAQRLVARMDRDPDAWRNGVVVIAIGGNDIGHDFSLDLLAADPMAAEVMAKTSSCLAQIRSAITLIHGSHPQTRFILVGMIGDVNDPSNLGRWRSAAAQRNIAAGYDAFDQGLIAMAKADPTIAFADIRGWFARQWGGRDAQGMPSYKTVAIGNGFAVTNTAGDDPKNELTADEHTGVVWNAFWSKELVELMDASFGAGIPPLTDAEIAAFLRPAIAASH